jgi:isoleucyl-tRNA synthetase
LLPEEYRPEQCGKTYVPERDTLDVWFDSGSSWRAVVEAREGAGVRADVYLEGSDQHRGWFQSSLLTHVACQTAEESTGTITAPYKTLVTHGFVLDESRRKMSKSLGNGIDPDGVIASGLGADVLRFWAASADFTTDVNIGESALEVAADAVRKIRNTGRSYGAGGK